MFKKYLLFYLIYIVFILYFYSSNCYSYFSEFFYPIKNIQLTSEYGYRELFGKINFHNGIDFGAAQGSDVYSISSGFVSFVGFINGYGNTIIIKHSNGYKSLYAHLDENFTVYIGEKINTSDIIAKVGPKYLSNGIQNGNTTGPHLHLTIFDKNNNTINPLSLKLKELK